MSTTGLESADWAGREALDRDGLVVGVVTAVFAGAAGPSFATIDDGSGDEVAVPLEGVALRGGRLALPHTRERIASAPLLREDARELSAADQASIRRHFARGEAPTTPVPPQASASDDEDVTLVLSEEQLDVETRRVPTDRIRLRKVVVEEEVTLTVTLRREDLVVERLPIEPDEEGEERDPAPTDLGEGGATFLLYAEEPVVQRRIVPVERVRVRRDEVVEEQTLTETVRRERADADREKEPR